MPQPATSSSTSHSRKSSFANHPSSSPSAAGGQHSNAPVSFFLASEQDVMAAMERQDATRESESAAGVAATDDKSKEERQEGGVRSVQSIQEALAAAFGPSGDATTKEKPLSRSGSSKSRSGGDANADISKKRKRRSRATEPAVEEDGTGVETPRHDGSSIQGSPVAKNIRGHVRRQSTATASAPLTPINIESPAYHPDSAMQSSPKSVSLRSLRLSDDGEREDAALNDNASQAVASSDDDEEDIPGSDEGIFEHHHTSSSAPELVMPSIAMPARRPFTEKGKNLGRLKIMVAGGAGVGKTGLIRSIVRICGDIVHVDPVPVPISGTSVEASKTSKENVSDKTAQEPGRSNKARKEYKTVSEIYTSTRAYPPWWSDVEESRVLRRRKSMGLGDTVLERNVCFVDTPGWTATNKAQEKVVRYMESLLARSLDTASMSDSDILSMLSGSGGASVDVVLYIFGRESVTEDVVFFKRLSTFANTIPLIGKADALSAEELASLKISILTALQSEVPKAFLFGRTVADTLSSLTVNPTSTDSTAASEGADAGNTENLEISQSTAQEEKTEEVPNERSDANLSQNAIQPPFAISSAPGPDYETMDASLLMSSEYCPPLVSSELEHLLSLVFEPENASWLRHSAARKALVWRRSRFNTASGTWKRGLDLPSSTWQARSATLASAGSSRTAVPKWAASLSQALRNERARDDRPSHPPAGVSRLLSDSDTAASRAGSTSEKRKAKARRPTRHWSEISSSQSSSRSLQHKDSGSAQWTMELMSSVMWNAMTVLGTVGAVGAVVCVVARKLFGIESVTIQWDW